jgi:uncharacterized protein (DUF1778 family)
VTLILFSLVCAVEHRTSRQKARPQCRWNRTALPRSRCGITPEALAVLKRAAELQGPSLSDFVVAAAQQATHRVIEEVQIIRLSVEDQRAFAEAILNPPRPSPTLRRAPEAHGRLIGKP